jgi:hypothetical protein
VTGVSVLQLLLGGILPGLLCVVMLMAMTGWLAVRRGYPRAERWPTWQEAWRDFKPAFPAILAPVILIAGMLAGFFTPTEIASVTVLYALLISSLFYRELTWRGILDASYETIRSSAGILLIVAVAALFGWILSVEGVPQKLTELMLKISTNPYVLLFIVNLLLLLVGMFPRQHHRDPGDRADHRQAAGDGRGRPGAPRHGGGVQPDDRAAHAADGPRAVPGRRHREGDDEGSAEGDAALLHSAGDHAAAHHLHPGDHHLDPAPRAGQARRAHENPIALAMGDPAASARSSPRRCRARRGARRRAARRDRRPARVRRGRESRRHLGGPRRSSWT